MNEIPSLQTPIRKTTTPTPLEMSGDWQQSDSVISLCTIFN